MDVITFMTVHPPFWSSTKWGLGPVSSGRGA